MRHLFLLALLFSSLHLFAQEAFKCRSSTGYMYQDRPCKAQAAVKQDESLQVVHAPFGAGSEEIRLKDRVLETLKDPGSAQFKELVTVNSGVAICGMVNSRNSYGGYVGFKAFVADGEGVYFSGDGSGPVDVNSHQARRTYYPKAYRYGCVSR